MKKTFLLLTSLLLLASCENSSSLNSSGSQSIEPATDNSTSTISSINTSSTSESSSTSTETSSYTSESIISLIADQLFDNSNKYSYDSEYDQYYIVFSFVDEVAKNKEEGLNYLISLINMPNDFLLEEDKINDEFDDGTALIYSLYSNDDVFVEIDTYEDLDSSNNIIAVWGQIISGYNN